MGGIVLSEQTSLYFFSAWLQADAALFAIVGIFGIYKLQSLENTINSAMATFPFLSGIREEEVTAFAGKDGDGKKEMIEHFKEIKPVYRNLYFWMKATEKIPKVKNLITPTMVLTGSGMILCSVGILGVYISKMLPCWATPSLMVSVFVYEVVTIITIIDKIKIVIEEHKPAT